MRRQLTTYLIVCLLLVLSACGQRDGTVRSTTSRSAEKAVAEYQAGNYFSALPVLLEAYESNPDNYDYAVMILDSYIQLGESTRGWGFLSTNPIDGKEIQILRAELMALSNGYDAALEELETLDFSNAFELETRWLIRGLTLKQQLHAQRKQYLESALAGMQLYQYQTDKSISDSIVSDLLMVPDETLGEVLSNVEFSDLDRGWLEAAYIDFGADGSTAGDWLARWPSHPAAAYFYQDIGNSGFRNIAYLLPLSGRFEAVGKAIQQGVLAAGFDYLAPQSKVQFYDTGSYGESFAAAWYSAQEENADIIVGPLDKESMNQLASYSVPSIPVLLLNQSELSQYYQFTLSPEDEAVIAAQKMYEEGHRRVLVMAPRDEWGQRLGNAFIQAFMGAGGLVINQSYYQEIESDFSPQLRQALGLIESQLRIQRLQTAMQRKLVGEERVHDDVDAIFMAARPQFARLLIPQLKFHRAGKVPVYSTSHIFSGNPDSNADRDLNGVKFSVSDFEVGADYYAETLNFDPARVRVDKRLFAFGYDAMLLVSRLNWLQRFPGGQIKGLSGQLNIGLDGVIRRNLDWAVFAEGVPQVIDD